MVKRWLGQQLVQCSWTKLSLKAFYGSMCPLGHQKRRCSSCSSSSLAPPTAQHVGVSHRGQTVNCGWCRNGYSTEYGTGVASRWRSQTYGSVSSYIYITYIEYLIRLIHENIYILITYKTEGKKEV